MRRCYTIFLVYTNELMLLLLLNAKKESIFITPFIPNDVFLFLKLGSLPKQTFTLVVFFSSYRSEISHL